MTNSHIKSNQVRRVTPTRSKEIINSSYNEYNNDNTYKKIASYTNSNNKLSNINYNSQYSANNILVKKSYITDKQPTRINDNILNNETNDVINSRQVNGDRSKDNKRPKSNINNKPTELDSTYTHYKKIRTKPRIDDKSPMRLKDFDDSQDNSYKHIMFDKTFGKNCIPDKEYYSPTFTCNGNVTTNPVMNKKKSYDNSFSLSRTSEKLNDSRLSHLPMLTEARESFSLLKKAEYNQIGNPKETSDSSKMKITYANSTDEKFYSNCESIEETHFMILEIIRKSKNVMRTQEKIYEKENLFSTVTQCEEKEL